MTNDEHTTKQQFEERLRDALRDDFSLKDVKIPDSVDHAVFALIDGKVQEIEAGKRSYWDRRYFLYPLAAAALLLLGVTVSLRMPQPDADVVDLPSPIVAEAPAETKTPDIVDAYLLARRIENRDETSQDDDHDSNGLVDHGDVAELARVAVSLEITEENNGV